MKTILFLILLSFGLSAQAAKVINIKQNKALIDLEGDSFNPGDKLFAIDDQGKKKAILQVRQVKGGKAVADILKGSAQAQFTVTLAQSAGSSARSGSSQPKGAMKANKAWGLTAGYAMNNMTAKPSSNVSVDLSGSSFSVKAFYDMRLDGAISVRASTGYDSFVGSGTSGTAACSGSSSCDVNIGYLGLDALVRYSFIESSYRVWAGAGLGFLLALSKSSNVLDTGKITTNQTILVSLGADIPVGKSGAFIPLQFDYALYPSNNTTSANQMIFRAGYGWSF